MQDGRPRHGLQRLPKVAKKIAGSDHGINGPARPIQALGRPRFDNRTQERRLGSGADVRDVLRLEEEPTGCDAAKRL